MKIKHKYPRSSGVLLSIPMLHGPYGIGVLGEEAVEFLDFLCEAGFHAWQVLPVEHTGDSFSPYTCVSAFAGEPLLIDPRMLLEMDLITADELSWRAEGLSEDFVDYALVREKQISLLRTAFSRLTGRPYSGFRPFWLEDYSLYMALKEKFGNQPWYDWPDEGLRNHSTEAVKLAKKDMSEEMRFYRFVQWLFAEQWHSLKEQAESRGVSIIGDMPFYVSRDSVEVWSKRRQFDIDSEGEFVAVGGAPPDYFNPDGQLWGDPVYNWRLMQNNGYRWWIDRVKAALERYDIIRLDHFRGFESYWRIPANAESAKEGAWEKGPGLPLFKAMKQSLGDMPVIAEDLGDIDEDVVSLLHKTGFRGMRVLQFGFMGDELHLPHNFPEDCVAYTGTHDNTPLLDWTLGLAPEDRDRSLFYVGFEGDWTAGGPNCAINTAWIRTLFANPASLVIVPIQDLLGYGGDTRTNIPGTSDGNWRFRIRYGVLSQINAGFFTALNKVTCRTGNRGV